MAQDLKLFFHGTTSAGATVAASALNGPTVDLGSESVNRVMLIERRISGGGGTALNITFQEGSDGTNFVNMPGTTSSATLGFAPATTSSYGSTDAVAPSGPAAVARIAMRFSKRYARAVFTPVATTASTFTGITLVGKPLGGAFSGKAGPVDI